MFKKTILSNNLRVITIPMQGVTTATILVMVNTGSNNETKEINGISHFLEHMFFKGTKRRPDTQMIAEEIDAMGGYSNAFTSREHTGYYLKVPAQKFEQALDLISDIFFNSLLKQSEVEKERGAILQELNMILDDPRRYIGYVFEKLLYGDQPAGWEIIGTPKTLAGLDAQKLREYFMKQYTVDDTFVVVSGNIDADGALASIAEKFGNMRTGETKGRPLVADQQQKPASSIFFKETDQTHIVLGARAFGVADNHKRFPAAILAHILGGSMASRIWSEVREKRGLAYAVMSSFDAYTTYGMFATYAGVEHKNAEEAIAIMCNEYAKIRDEGVRAEELARTKESMKGHTALSLEGSDDLAFYVGGEEVLTGKPMTPEEVYGKIDSVGAEEVQAVAREIFQPERLNLAVIGPFREKEKFDALFKL